MDKLLEEVENGKSSVMVNGHGEVERVVSVVALHVEDDSGRLLVQLGKWEANKLNPACQLPGAKQERDELTFDAVRRVLETKVAPLAGLVEVVKAEREVSEK